VGVTTRGISRPALGVVALCALVLAQTAAAKPLKVVDRVRADAGQKVTLFSNKDFKVKGDCVDNGGGDYTADTFLTAKRANLAFDT
jgi:hypothetical protein